MMNVVKFVLLGWLAVSLVVFAENDEETHTHARVEEAGEQSPPSWDFYNWDYLTGDWMGYRTRLADIGIEVEVVYTGEIYSNVRGGIRRKTEYLDNFDLMLSVDAEKLVGWPGAEFFIYCVGNNGGNPSSNIGDAQCASNIEANSTWKIYEAWYQQSLFDGRLFVKAGLYDINSEFDVIETAGLFLNSSHGIGPDFSQSGLNGPSIFPVTSLGVRAKVQPEENIYLQVAVVDGVPGDLGNPKGTQIIFKSEDGVLITAEIAYLVGTGENSQDAYGKYAIGGWYYTAKFDDVLAVDGAGEPLRRQGNSGVYLLAEQTVYRESDDPDQGLAIYGRTGIADGKINQFYLYTGFGLVYTGLVPSRDKDRFGFAVAIAHNGDDFIKAQENAGTPVDRQETNFELTYFAQITPWLVIQPDLQFILNPGTDSALHNALAMGVRVYVSF